VQAETGLPWTTIIAVAAVGIVAAVVIVYFLILKKSPPNLDFISDLAKKRGR
jgi:hypothetical protein